MQRLPGPHLTHHVRLFPSSLTTTVFSQRSRGRFEASPRRAAPKGLQSFIFRTAPLSVIQLTNDLQRSWHTGFFHELELHFQFPGFPLKLPQPRPFIRKYSEVP